MPQWGRASEGSETRSVFLDHGNYPNGRNGAEPRKARRLGAGDSGVVPDVIAAMGPSLGRLGDQSVSLRVLWGGAAAMGPSLGRLGDAASPDRRSFAR